MPTSLDDQARLPPLTPYDEVAERQRLADMKAFRQYLVETGTVSTMVKLYKHTAKNEMRLPNPTILKEFLANHVEEADTQEIEALTEENAVLRERQAELQAQADILSQDLTRAQRLSVGTSLWRFLVSADFWGGELDDDARAAGLPASLFYRRLCGQKVDKGTREVLVNRVRPGSCEEKELAGSPPIAREFFSAWIADSISESLHAWCCDELLPRCSSLPVPSEPPFEREILQAIRDTGLYPDNLDQVRYMVDLDPKLLDFLNAVAEAFPKTE